MSETPRAKEDTLERLQTFRQKMWELKRAEEEKARLNESRTAHFDGLNPEMLTEEDADMYEKYLNNVLTIEEFKKYREQFLLSKPGDARSEFAAYMGNILQIKQLKEELKKLGLENKE